MLIRLVVCWLLAMVPMATGQIVINEVFYNAPDDVERLEWIELFNSSAETVDLSDWSLTGGIDFKIPKETLLPAGQYLVISKDLALFKEFYAASAIGGFKKSLSNRGDTVQLRNGDQVVDTLQYADRAPWPVAADGYGASLERITPGLPSHASNWSASPMPPDRNLPGGSPGRQNDRHSPTSLPLISQVSVDPQWPAPQGAITVACKVTSQETLQRVELEYQILQDGSIGKAKTIPMSSTSDGYRASIAGQESGVLVRIRIRAFDDQEKSGLYPAPDLRPAISRYVTREMPDTNVGLAFIIAGDSGIAGQLSKGSGTGARFGMRRPRGPSMIRATIPLENAWAGLMLDDLSPPTFTKVRRLFRQHASARANLIAEVESADNSNAAMGEAQAKAAKAFEEFNQDLKKQLDQETHARYQERINGPRDPIANFLRQILPLERFWLAVETEMDRTDEQSQQLRAAMTKVLADRKERLGPLLKQLQRQRAGFQEVQAAAGEIESQMWQTLRPQLSFRQNRFARKWYGQNASMMGSARTNSSSILRQGKSAFVHIDAVTRKKQLFDFVDILPRSAGFKVRFHKDQLFNEMSTTNIIFEVKDRFVLAEALAFDLYRRVGTPACKTDFARLHLDGKVLGYHLLFEQPNKAFLRRNKRNADGDLYKLIWYGKGIEGKYESKTQPEYGHAKLAELLRQLDDAEGEPQWAIINQNFNVNQIIDYFAVNMCLSHWDGFFNNYFAYHDVQDSGKWELYPWDQDKTWGYHDGMGADQVFTNMPLSFGMEGDTPPGGGRGGFGSGWWRPGGEFSKPLLANPQFRQRFLKRLHTILQDTYNEDVYYPIIDQLAEQLRPEVAVRATALGNDAKQAESLLDQNIALLKRHISERRDFLLDQDELKSLTAE